MKNILFLGGLFPEDLQDEIIRNSKTNVQYAADTLQKAFVRGLSYHYPSFKVLNFPFIGAYPTRYRKPYIRSCKIDGVGESIGFFNVIGFKNYSIYKKAKKKIEEWITSSNEDKVIVIYSLQLPYVKAAVDAKRKYPSVKICQIVADLPEFMGGPKSFIHTIYKKLTISLLNKSYPFIDSYVLLSKYMADYFKISDDKWVVVEGIFDELKITSIDKQISTKEILYTGTLSKRFGVLDLVNAFKLIPDKDYRLIICGDGDTKDVIAKEADIDKRIIYKGTLNRGEILGLQRRATLLVNPRTAEGEFTKFSFPSKTMEYLASGTPTLLYRLPGIPEEYFQYCYVVDEKINKLTAEHLQEICEKDGNELMEKGKIAQKFILENKNPIAQCDKVAKLINKLF